MELDISMAMDLSAVPMKARVAVGIIVVSAGTLIGVAEFEQYRETAYVPVKGDVPTIGYGSTKGVRMGDKTTPAQALRRLGSELEGVYANGLKKCITVPLYDYEFGAYVSLAYSVGVPTVCRKAKPNKDGVIEPNLIDLINAERYDEACERIEAFNRGPSPGKDAKGEKIPGPVLRGLVKRRAAERDMCEGKLSE